MTNLVAGPQTATPCPPTSHTTANHQAVFIDPDHARKSTSVFKSRTVAPID